MYLDQPLRNFMDALASRSPTPGGGSAAALAGALSAALVSMVANLTLGKDRYRTVRPQIEAMLEQAEKLRSEMQVLMQKDSDAFGALVEVFQMPHVTEAEKSVRELRQQESLKKACQVPLDIGIKALEAARLALKAAEIGSAAAVSDAGVAAVMANACAQSAALNVKINLNGIEDESFNRKVWPRMQQTLQEVSQISGLVLELTYRKIEK